MYPRIPNPEIIVILAPGQCNILKTSPKRMLIRPMVKVIIYIFLIMLIFKSLLYYFMTANVPAVCGRPGLSTRYDFISINECSRDKLMAEYAVDAPAAV